MTSRFRDSSRWLHGGCLAFAKALAKAVGPRAEILDVITGGTVVNHVVVRADGTYHDAERAYDRKQILRAWGIAGASVLPHDDARCRRWGVVVSVEEIRAAAGIAAKVARERGLGRSRSRA